MLAYECNKIALHSYVWVRFDGEVDDENIKLTSNPLKNNYTISTYTERIVKKDEYKQIIAQYVLTTPGRILLNKVLFDSLTITN